MWGLKLVFPSLTNESGLFCHVTVLTNESGVLLSCNGSGFVKGGAWSELYYTAQIAVTCFQIIVQLSPVLSLHSYWLLLNEYA